MLADCTCEPLAPFGTLVCDRLGGTPLSRVPPDELRQELLRSRLLVLRGFAPFADKQELAEYCRGWGELLEWDFGTVFEVVEHDSPKNYLFTSGSVPYHWDGAFARQVPWLQVFSCRESPGADQGGETIFCDTARVWSAAPQALRQRWRAVEVEYFTEKVAHYGGQVRAGLVGSHPLTGETTLRFAEPANADTVRINTPELQIHGVAQEEAPGLLAELLRFLYDPRFVYAHAWQTGVCVIADNHVLLHGRTPYKSKLPRRLWRVHVL